MRTKETPSLIHFDKTTASAANNRKRGTGRQRATFPITYLSRIAGGRDALSPFSGQPYNIIIIIIKIYGYRLCNNALFDFIPPPIVSDDDSPTKTTTLFRISDKTGGGGDMTNARPAKKRMVSRILHNPFGRPPRYARQSGRNLTYKQTNKLSYMYNCYS